MSSRAELEVRVAGRFARDALAAGDGEVCAIFQRSFYLRTAAGFACFGDARLGRGPLNALLDTFPSVTLGAKLAASLAGAEAWTPPPFHGAPIALADARPPDEGFGGLVIGRHNALAVHAQPALEAIERWLVGHSLDVAAEGLIGLGPGLTPSGDDYLGGVMVALQMRRRGVQAASLWRWLEPRLDELDRGELATLASAVARSVAAKARVVQADEREREGGGMAIGAAGRARPRVARQARGGARPPATSRPHAPARHGAAAERHAPGQETREGVVALGVDLPHRRC